MGPINRATNWHYNRFGTISDGTITGMHCTPFKLFKQCEDSPGASLSRERGQWDGRWGLPPVEHCVGGGRCRRGSGDHDRTGVRRGWILGWDRHLLLISLPLIYSTEFPIPLFMRFRHVLFWEFPCPAWAVARCSSGPLAGGNL